MSSVTAQAPAGQHTIVAAFAPVQPCYQDVRCVEWAGSPSFGGCERVQGLRPFPRGKGVGVDSKATYVEEETAMHCEVSCVS